MQQTMRDNNKRAIFGAEMSKNEKNFLNSELSKNQQMN
jgi:hypothetical protein